MRMKKLIKDVIALFFINKNSELYLFFCELKSKGLEPIQYETQLIRNYS